MSSKDLITYGMLKKFRPTLFQFFVIRIEEHRKREKKNKKKIYIKKYIDILHIVLYYTIYNIDIILR